MATKRDSAADRILTLLLLAGEALAAPQGSEIRAPFRPEHAQTDMDDPTGIMDDMSGLLPVVEQIQALAAGSPALADCLEALPAAFGDGETLRLLFLNLFPPEGSRELIRADTEDCPTQRELEVLYFSANDYSREAIARDLNISSRTVEKHLQNAFRKPNVRKAQPALTKAISRGYLKFDMLGYRLHQIRYHTDEAEAFRLICTTVGDVDPPFAPKAVNPLAAF